MPLRAGSLVGEVAATIPEALGAFRAAGVDCCRDARLSLREAAVRTGVRSDRLIALMRPHAAGPTAVNWSEAPFRVLTRHIVQSIHPGMIASMESLSLRLARVAHATPNDWSVGYVRSAFAEVANNLVIHVWRVENEVFPLLERLEDDDGTPGERLGPEDLPDPRDPMLEGLRDLRAITQDYALEQPEELTALLPDLSAFDDALHRHIHLEHHVLFARVAAIGTSPLAEGGRAVPSL